MNEQDIPRAEILDPAFYMPQLDRTRRIWAFLPEGYTSGEKRYPVIYMQDGQNLFDNSTAANEEWYLGETLAALRAQCIIIGIDNGEDKRSTEYNFRDSEEFGQGEGRKYVEFIIQTLKPVIDEKFRTLPERDHTFIAGSSLGGLISFYAAMYFPEIFGGAAVFSPSFWLVPDLVTEMQPLAEKNQLSQFYYFYGAEQESKDMLKSIGAISAMLSEYGRYKILLDLYKEGEHKEIYWGQRFTNFYKWMEANWALTGSEIINQD